MIFLLVLSSFGYTYKATKGVTRKDEIKDLKEDIQNVKVDVKHVSDRVDQIYEHLLRKREP